MTSLFVDVEVNHLCTSNGMIYYTNLTGELICFDGSEKHTVSDRIFNAICADDSHVYGVGTSGVFGYDSGFNETVYRNTTGGYRIRAYDERIAFETRNGWAYIDENGERDIGEAENVFVCSNGLIIENGVKYVFYK